MSQQEGRRVYRENDKGQFDPVPIMETSSVPPSAEDVMAALRDFVRQAGPGDLVLLRPDQARVLYDRCAAAAKQLRRVADGLDGGQP